MVTELERHAVRSARGEGQQRHGLARAAPGAGVCGPGQFADQSGQPARQLDIAGLQAMLIHRRDLGREFGTGPGRSVIGDIDAVERAPQLWDGGVRQILAGDHVDHTRTVWRVTLSERQSHARRGLRTVRTENRMVGRSRDARKSSGSPKHVIETIQAQAQRCGKVRALPRLRGLHTALPPAHSSAIHE